MGVSTRHRVWSETEGTRLELGEEVATYCISQGADGLQVHLTTMAVKERAGGKGMGG